MDIRGDLNEIKNHDEKNGGNRRSEGSFIDFMSFISKMGMGDIRFQGSTFTWANNREREGYIQERVDRFFGSVEWMSQFDTVEVNHILRQTSDHYLLLLDSKPQRTKTKSRFIFESRWVQMQDSEGLIKAEWSSPVTGSRMYQVPQKLKNANSYSLNGGRSIGVMLGKRSS